MMDTRTFEEGPGGLLVIHAQRQTFGGYVFHVHV